MQGLLGWLGLFGCGGAPPAVAVARPALGVAVPLSGPDVAAGTAAVNGVTLAAGADVDVIPFDDAVPGAAAGLASLPAVFGVVAHVVRASAEAQADGWLATDLPVVVAAPGSFSGVPRVVPPLVESARCAAAFLDADFWVRTDGSALGMAAGKALLDAIPEHAIAMDTVDPAQSGSAASQLLGRRARTVVWTGDPGAGGNFLRVLRQVGFDRPFFGIGAYDERFLAAAGDAAEGASVSAEERPARDPAFVAAFTARFGLAPSEPAVDAYDAAVLLIAAWRSAGDAGAPVTRATVRANLETAVATGANGSMYLGADQLVQPVVCGSFQVSEGAFVPARIASEADRLLSPPPPKKRRPRW